MVQERLVMSLWPEAGKALNVSRPTIYKLAREGKLPTMKLGSRIIVPRKAFEDWLASVKPANEK